MKKDITNQLLKRTAPFFAFMLCGSFASAFGAAVGAELAPMPGEDGLALVVMEEESAEDIARRMQIELLQEQLRQARALADYYAGMEERLALTDDGMTEEQQAKKQEDAVTIGMMTCAGDKTNLAKWRIAQQYNALIELAETYDASKYDVSIPQVRTVVEALDGKTIEGSLLTKKQINRAKMILFKGKIRFYKFNPLGEIKRFPFLADNEDAGKRQWQKISALIGAAYATLKAVETTLTPPADGGLLLTDEAAAPKPALEA